MKHCVVVSGVHLPLGREVARALGPDAESMAVMGRGPGQVAKVSAELTSAGAMVLPMLVDTERADDLEVAVERIEVALGPIGLWVEVTGHCSSATFRDLDASAFLDVTRGFYLGPVHVAMAVLERMERRGGGGMIYVLPADGTIQNPALAGAASALRAVIGSVAGDLRSSNSKVTLDLLAVDPSEDPQVSVRDVVRSARMVTV